MTSITNKKKIIGIIVFCILVLISTFFIEYILKHAPCNLCLIERIPYIATIVLALIALIFDKYEKIALIFIGLFFVFGTVVSFYHFGIEQGFFNESLVCSLVENSNVLTAQDLLKELETKSISCKDVTFKVFGLSLATLNTIISLVISVIIFRLIMNYEKNQ
jgi:disulfide bond formation protein DsbB